MKVLIIAPQPFFSERGTPIAVRRLADALCRDGHQVDLLTYPFGDDIEMDGLTIHRCGRCPGVRRVGIGFSLAKLAMDLMLLLQVYRLGKPGRYDVVHAVEESIYLALFLRRRHRSKVIYDMDSSLADQLGESRVAFRPFLGVLRRIERWAMLAADVVAPMCHELADYAATVRNAEDVVVLHDVPTQASVGTALARLPSANGNGATPHCLALYVGNLEPYQGIDMLLDAAALLPPQSGIRVQVFGGPMEEVVRLRRSAVRRGLQDRIQFLGPRPLRQLSDLLSSADILLSPRTKGTNTPLKLYSYMESGRAILATRLRTHTQVLDDSTALLVEAKAEDYASGLLRLAEDEDLRRDLGASAKQRVRHQYSPDSFYRRVRAIYGRPHRKRAKAANGAGAAERRASRDRRTGSDRRSAPRNSIRSRRAGERRAPWPTAALQGPLPGAALS